MAVMALSRLYFGGWALLLMGLGLAVEAAPLARAASRFVEYSGQGRAPRPGFYRLAAAALMAAGAYLIHQSGGVR